MKFVSLIFSIGAMTWLVTCSQQKPQEQAAPTQKISLLQPAGADYWYQGKAELNSYDVVQERYGELREASEVKIFVTEDFSANKQVKLESELSPGDQRVPILKLNAIRRFRTGIYDYSLMQSVFTPMETQKMRTLKITATIQDWCGQVFVQCNAVADAYKIQSFSYFEAEGDAETQVKADLLEDEIWTLIRLRPESLARRQAIVLPSASYARFRHKPLQSAVADISLEPGERESVLHLVYSAIPRQLHIRYETPFPHRILGWEETIEGKLANKGTLKKTMMDAYWRHNDNASSALREELSPGF